MATRTVKGTRTTFSVSTGSDITNEGAGPGLDRSSNIRCFSTGDLTVDIVRSTGVSRVQIFQEDNFTGASAPSGLSKDTNISQSGKGKGKVGVTVTDATKDYHGYSEMSYDAIVDVP
jgi:hypothetical protein